MALFGLSFLPFILIEATVSSVVDGIFFTIVYLDVASLTSLVVSPGGTPEYDTTPL